MQRENFQTCRSPSTLEARIPGKFILQAEYPPKKKTMRSFQLAPQKWDHMAIPNQSSNKEIQRVEGKNEKKWSAKQISKSSAETQSVCLLP
jgi:hypothetical protein